MATKTYKLNTLPEFIHMTYDTDLQLVNIEQDGHDIKPSGLYYAKDTEWIKFCKDGFGDRDDIIFTEDDVKIENKWQLYKVVIDSTMRITLNDKPDKNKILVLSTYEDTIAFRELYKYYLSDAFSLLSIDWKKLADNYGGLELENYHEIKKEYNKLIKFDENYFHNLNLGMWYTLFDVNGGCIWNVDLCDVVNCTK